MEFFAGVLFAMVVFTIVYAVYSDRKKAADGLPKTPTEARGRLREMFSQAFAALGWSSWDASVHSAPGQWERMGRAINSRAMKIVAADPDHGICAVMGESGETYHVSADGCTCMDFRARGLPCKHMYFFAMKYDEQQSQGQE